jgi:2-aminoadipate transaminase
MPEFAKRLAYMEQTAEVLRGLFGTMSDPSIISFGGGAPASSPS